MAPSLVPNQAEFCALCGRSSTVIPEFNDHHVLARSLGGTEVIRICIDCHNRIHAQEHRYQLSVTDDNVYLLVDGKIAVERSRRTPEGWDEGTFVATLQNAPHHLRELAPRFRFLSDEGLVNAGEAMAAISNVAWEMRARLFLTALRRTPWGDKDKVLLDVAKQFGIERSQARKEAQVIGWFDEHLSTHADELPPLEAARVIMHAADPEQAMETWQERRVEDPTYSARQFARDVKGEDRTWCNHNECPTCGARLPHYTSTTPRPAGSGG